MNTIDLREITLQNLDDVIGITVGPAQTDLVADNLYSIAQAGLDPSGWCRAAYLDGKPVGFVFVKSLNEGSLRYICRFMVSHTHQGRGIGRLIMQTLLQTLFSSPSVIMVDLAVSREAGGAEDFYRKCGFTSTGEPYRGGWRMTMLRSQFLNLNARSFSSDLSETPSSDTRHPPDKTITHWHLVQMSDPTSAGCDLVRQWLREHNWATNPAFMALLHEPRHDARPLILLAYSDDAVIGGLFAETQLSWLRISIMAVHPEYRSKGIGSALLAEAERLSLEHGCRHAYVDTMDYQAPHFYLAHGFQKVGLIPDWDSHGHSKLFFIKHLRTSATST